MTVRNKFEAKFQKANPTLEYEAIQLSYKLECRYTPDFIDRDARTIWETKGRFTATDRRKMRAVKLQNPDWRIIIVFQHPNRPISKASKTTYAGWCARNGIEWQQG